VNIGDSYRHKELVGTPWGSPSSFSAEAGIGGPKSSGPRVAKVNPAKWAPLLTNLLRAV